MKGFYLISLAISLIWVSCGSNEEEKTGYVSVKGYTQGTSYEIIYKDSIDHREGIEQILNQIDQDFNLWILLLL